MQLLRIHHKGLWSIIISYTSWWDLHTVRRDLMTLQTLFHYNGGEVMPNNFERSLLQVLYPLLNLEMSRNFPKEVLYNKVARDLHTADSDQSRMVNTSGCICGELPFSLPK